MAGRSGLVWKTHSRSRKVDQKRCRGTDGVKFSCPRDPAVVAAHLVNDHLLRMAVPVAARRCRDSDRRRRSRPRSSPLPAPHPSFRAPAGCRAGQGGHPRVRLARSRLPSITSPSGSWTARIGNAPLHIDGRSPRAPSAAGGPSIVTGASPSAALRSARRLSVSYAHRASCCSRAPCREGKQRSARPTSQTKGVRHVPVGIWRFH